MKTIFYHLPKYLYTYHLLHVTRKIIRLRQILKSNLVHKNTHLFSIYILKP